MNTKKRGQIYLMSALLLAGAAALGLALIGVYLRDLRLAYEFGESTRAIFAADSAVENILYKKKNPGDLSVKTPIMSNDTVYSGNMSDDGSMIRGVGESKGIKRGIEIYMGDIIPE